ncbi:hypothetical protein FQA39_LY01182 [Lamprigera yunnana]|nr:hypothetical protein FQA39_LY01182 [Lamprigera yunnana]
MSSIILRNCAKLCSQSLFRKTEPIKLKSTYRAVLVKDPNKEFKIEKVSQPRLDTKHVRIQVHYCSVNSNDLSTFHDTTKSLPFTPGYEFGGEIIELGKKVSKEEMLPGEKVVALSLENFGGLAEECVVNSSDVFRLPSNLGLKDAVILIKSYSLALLAFSKAKVKKDEYVIISAGAAGLGLAAVDIAANVYGAKVIAVVDSNDKAEVMRDKGAFKTVVTDSKLTQHLQSALDKKPARIIYDSVGSSVDRSLFECVASGGQIFLAASHLYKGIPPPPLNTSLTVLDLLQIKKSDPDAFRCTVNDVLDLADQGLISAFISKEFSFEDINKAIKFIEDHKSTGNVLISML